MRKQAIYFKLLFLLTYFQSSYQNYTQCIIQNNQLIVSETGCALQKQADEIIVDKIILNGQLILNDRNTLKYKSLEIQDKAAITFTSYFEKIIFQDISESQCTPSQLNQININFSSKSKNQWYDIEYDSDYSIKLINKKAALLDIGKQVFLVSENNFIQAEITDISGDIIKIDKKWQKNDQLISIKEGLQIKVYDQLILFDENRVTFIKQLSLIFYIFIQNDQLFDIKIVSNCLNIQSSTGSSNGALFLNMKGLIYQTGLNEDKINLSDIIMIQENGIKREGATQFKANIKDAIFIHHSPVLQLQGKLTFERISLIHSGNINIDNPLDTSIVYKNLSLYSSQSKITFKQKADGNLIIDGFLFFQSKISFSFENDKIDSLTLINGVISTDNIDEINNINALYYKNTQFYSTAFINTSNYQANEIGLFDCLIDGTNLSGAIQVKDNFQQKFLINQVKFINFAQSKLPLIYSLNQSGLFNNQIQNPGESLINYEIYIFECVFSFDKSKVKLIDLPKLKLFYNDQTLIYPHQVINLDYDFYEKKDLIRIKNLFISDQYLFYLRTQERLSLIQFNMPNGQDLYKIKIEMQDGIKEINFNEHFYLVDTFEYNVYINLKENKSNQNNNLQLNILTNYGQSNLNSKVRIYLDSKQPIQSMQSLDQATLDSLDNSIILSPNDNLEQVISLKLTLCNQSEVIEGNQCKSECTDKTIVPLRGICFNKSETNFPRYILSQDTSSKSYLAQCPWYCTECTDILTCTVCDKITILPSFCNDLQYKQTISSNNLDIVQCQNNCLSCKSENECSVCDYSMGLSTENICKYPEKNQFIMKGMLVNCPEYCKECYSDTYCSKCQDGYFIQKGQCVKQCEIGQFFYNGLCYLCQDNEVNCQNLFNRQCIDGYTFNQSSNSCEESLIPDPKICDGSNCYPCYKQTDKNCKNPYPPQCEEGQYYSQQNKKCLKCDNSCKECKIEATHCTACIQGNILNATNNQCEQCPDNYIPINNNCIKCQIGQFSKTGSVFCQECSSSCTECKDNSNYCLSCKDTFYLQNNQCLLCNSNCKKCENSNKCLECFSDDYQLEDDKCVMKKDVQENELSDGQIIGIVLGVIFSCLSILWLSFTIKRITYASLKVKKDENTKTKSSLEQLKQNSLADHTKHMEIL